MGLALQALAAALAIPQILDNIGKEKFGILALAWGLVSNAGFMELGIGRAMTQIASQMRGTKDIKSLATTIKTAKQITFYSSLVGGCVFLIVALNYSVFFSASKEIKNEIYLSVFLLAVALPAQAMSATYRGINEAFLNFRGISLLRMVLGLINFLGPLFVSYYSLKLYWLISTIAISRIVCYGAYRYLAKKSIREIKFEESDEIYSKDAAKKLIKFGGWATISSVISPLMSLADRFSIAYSISVVAVSTYVLPLELVSQSLLIVGAISSVIFPNLARKIKENPAEWLGYFKVWRFRVSILMAGVALLLNIFMNEILTMWIGNGLSNGAVSVGRVLCVGLFTNAVGAMYFSMIHAHGRADVTAKMHLIEFPILLIALKYFLEHWGIIGAAYVWCLRSILELLIMKIYSAKKLEILTS